MKTLSTNEKTGPALCLCRIGIVLGLSITLTGCSSLVGRNRGPLSNLDRESIRAVGAGMGPTSPSQVLTENGEPCVVLDVRDGKKHLEKIPLRPGESMFVGDMVKDAQLFKRIGKIKLTILRPNGTDRPPVRLDVDFDSTGQKVMEGQNYSLRAGDRVVVTRDETSMFTGLLTPFQKG
jgi:hypothetical protein